MQEKKGHLIASWKWEEKPEDEEFLKILEAVAYVFCHKASMEGTEALVEKYMREHFGKQWRKKGIFYLLKEDYLQVIDPERQARSSGLQKLREKILPLSRQYIPWRYFQNQFLPPTWEEIEAFYQEPYPLFPHPPVFSEREA